MCSTTSQIFSSAYMRLGQPTDDILSRVELANILYGRMSIRFESVRQSEQRVAIAKSSDFTLDASSNEKNLTTLETDFVIPLWVERQIVNVSQHPIWQFVPTVNLSQLQSRRAMLSPAVSFYGADSQEVIAQFSYYGNELATPFRTHRVWYSPTVTLPSTETEAILLPDNLINMLVFDCIVYAIPLMVVNASKQLKTSPDLKEQIGAWQLLLASAKEEQAQFERWFEAWRKDSRGGHRARRRRDVLRGDKTSANWLYGLYNRV